MQQPVQPSPRSPGDSLESHTPVEKRYGRFLDSVRRSRKVTVGALSLLLGAAGEVLLFYPGWRSLGAALLAAAALVAGFAWSGLLKGDRYWVVVVGEASPPTPITQYLSPFTLRYIGIAGAILLWLGSLLAWWASPDAIFGWQGILWLGSMGLLIASCARWHRDDGRERLRETEAEKGGGTSTSTLRPLYRRLSSAVRRTSPEIAIFTGILVLSLLTRLAWLNEVPWRFHADETVAYGEAMRFYRGPAISLFTTTWYGTSLPSLPFGFVGTLMHLVGTDLGGARFGVALIGALTVIPLYGLARMLAGRAAAVVASLAFATSASAVHYSRVSIVNMLTPFCWAICFYFLVKGLGSRRPLDFALSGLAGGLSLYTYFGARLLPYLLVVYAAYLLIFHFKAFRERMGHLALLGVGFVIGFGPLLAYFISNPETWAGRGISELTVPPTIPLSWSELSRDWNILAPLAWKDFLGLGVIPSGDHVYWGSMLLPPEAMLAILGAGMIVWRWRHPAYFLVLLWSASVLFVGGTLVTASLIPALANWTPAFPVFYLALALPVAAIVRALRALPRRVYVAGLTLTAVGVLAMAFANLYFYLAVYPAQVPPALESAQGRFLATLSPRNRVYFLGNSRVPYSPVVGAMLALDVPASDLLNPGRELPLSDVGRWQDLTFVFHSDHRQYLPLVEAIYPGGKAGQIETPGGPVGDIYTVTAAQVVSSGGALLTLDDLSGKEMWRGKVTAPGALPRDQTVAFPVRATWSGAFFMREPGTASLHLVGTGRSNKLWIQDETVPLGAPVALDAGWIPFRFEAVLDAPPNFHLAVQRGTGPPAELDRAHLWPLAPGAGLVATLRGDSLSRRIDLFVASSLLTGDLARAPDVLVRPPIERDPDFLPIASKAGVQTIQWDGEVYAEGGEYKMELRTDARASLSLDGKEVINIPVATPLTSDIFYHNLFEPVTAGVSLTPGWRKVRLELETTGSVNGLEWAWTRPDGVREIVPPSRLRHAFSDR